MKNQKLENMLNLALDATAEERKKSLQLNIGYAPVKRTWELIVKYSGKLKEVLGEEVQAVELLNGYAILTVFEEKIPMLAELPEIEFIEKPKQLFFSMNQGVQASCIGPLQSQFSQTGSPLTGKGIIVACVDSGVDYAHPDFCNEDGTTRIISFWDQDIQGKPPSGYYIGTEYTREEINEALHASAGERERLIPSHDVSGHGTGVLGIAAGNGRASNGKYRGIAYESDVIVVKLGTPKEGGFPRTTELMQGIDYVIRQALSLQRPVAVNLSFGNSYGSHSGESLLERYIDSVANLGRTVICVGMGNEGNNALHTSGYLKKEEMKEILLNVNDYEFILNIQIWKQYVDEMELVLIHPNGQEVGIIRETMGPQRFTAGSTELLLYYGEPSPFSVSQEVYIEFIPKNKYIDSGTWKIRLIPKKIVDGRYDLWLPGGGVINSGTKFLFPTPETTLTIPATARNVISVGAYDSRYMSYASFSGRGYTRVTNEVKPDVAAPGVNIQTTASGGGYNARTGTSFSTPFVTGAAALLMEWGIVRKNDPFLYGEKIKAYIRREANRLEGRKYPNEEMGFGRLCVKLPIKK